MDDRVRKIWVVVAGTLAFCGLGSVAALAESLQGDCVDCHTMHNSQGGQPVALVGTSTTATWQPIENLLRMDCIACHASDPNGPEKIVGLDGGSQIPQVMHADTSGDLAGGNFRYIAEGGNRKGHNVVDLVAADTENAFPPGHRHASAAVGEGGFDVERLTCAGSMGCHGYRGQVLSTSNLMCDPLTGIKYVDGLSTGEQCTAEDYANEGDINYYRTGLSALSGFDGFPTTSLKQGAHHSNYEGLKNDGLDPNYYDSPLAHSYRFILSLRGYGNETDRWQNVNATSHNEYVGGYADSALGDILEATDFGSTATCGRCHFGGSINDTNSRIYTPGGSVTGFCITCHGTFHSSGVTNGSSGAFLRHPSDYVIPDRDEYAAYTQYSVTAPVGRPHDFFVEGMSADAGVTPGSDLVMCLSCHVAHASPYDYMLRFDYEKMVAGGAAVADLGTGCLACHTTKGILPENR